MNGENRRDAREQMDEVPLRGYASRQSYPPLGLNTTGQTFGLMWHGPHPTLTLTVMGCS
jgi:hypothetical protein